MAAWTQVMERIARGEKVSEKDKKEAADGALRRDKSASTALTKAKAQGKAALWAGVEEVETAATFSALEVWRGYRGEKGLKVKGREITTVIGLGVQLVGIGGKAMGKKWGSHVNAAGRGVTLSGLGAMARQLGRDWANGRAMASAPTVTAPTVQGHPQPPYRGQHAEHGRPPRGRAPLQLAQNAGQPEVILTPDAAVSGRRRIGHLAAA